MNSKRPALILLASLTLISVLLVLTSQGICSHLRFGLEFKGGYEIYYVVSPASGKTALTSADLLQTAKILRQRADGMGMAEPDVRVEGENHIRLKLAGLTSANEARSLLGSAQGLPTVLTERYTQTVGSVLGNTALNDTAFAGALGIGCIFLVLLLFYRGLGLLAAFNTLIYLWLLGAVFVLTHATLSLSAVVAFVLGIGMAADASIICFERVKEEFALGHPPVEAVRRGFRGSLQTIRDANLVTALAMFALFAAGIGPIQGFSVTMLASIAISFSTNYLLVRWFALLLAKTGWLSPALLVGYRAPKTQERKRVDFAGWGRTVALASCCVIVAGTLYYRAHGMNLDIDFTAGTALDIDLDKPVTQEQATAIITGTGNIPDTLAVGGKGQDHIAVRFDGFLKPEQLKDIIAAFQNQYSKVEYEENTADPAVARSFAHRSLYALLFAFVSIALYIGWRFSRSVAFATILAILQDILLVSAIFALFKLEIDVTYVAALLTVIGYSLNDKIVIFSRIRENLAESRNLDGESARELVNRSVSQTMRRSLLTVLTVVLASICLYFFACEPLQMFSLAILLGLLSGAGSSIFLSTAVWLSVRKRKENELKKERVMLSPRFLIPGVVLAVILGAGWMQVPAWCASTAQAGQSEANASSGLGDLSAFRAIVQDSLLLVQKANFSAAKDRMTDLETAWDNAEEQLQPRSPSDWRLVDKSIDRALAAVRSGHPDAAACKQAMDGIMEKLTAVGAKGNESAKVIAAEVGKLGDMTAFLTIANDSLKLVQKGDLTAAKDRMTDLETAWDEAEDTLKPKNPADWRVVDKAIDHALAAVRSRKPEAAACESAIKTMIEKMNAVMPKQTSK